jgi:hypothetical protein
MTNLFDATKHIERNIPEFGWDDGADRAQAERYVSYVRQQLKLGWNWLVIDGKKHPKLLDNNLGGIEFKGTTNMAVIEQAAYSLPAIGLKIIFELKKGGSKIDERTEYQTIVSLLLANVVCKRLRLVAMLSNLVDKWIIFCLDGVTVLHHEFATRGKAVGFLYAILQGDVEPDAMGHSHDIAA